MNSLWLKSTSDLEIVVDPGIVVPRKYFSCKKVLCWQMPTNLARVVDKAIYQLACKLTVIILLELHKVHACHAAQQMNEMIVEGL